MKICQCVLDEVALAGVLSSLHAHQAFEADGTVKMGYGQRGSRLISIY